MEDVLGLIFGQVNNIWTFKAILWTCKTWRKVMQSVHPHKFAQLMRWSYFELMHGSAIDFGPLDGVERHNYSSDSDEGL